MKFKNTFILVLIASLFLSVAQIFFKLSGTGIFRSLSSFLNLYFLSGIIFMFVGGVIFLIALKKGELSFVYPLTSISYFFIAVLSVLIIKESIVFLHWVGLALISLGILIISGERNE